MDKPSGASSRFRFAGFEVKMRAREGREPGFCEVLRKVGLES